VTQEKKEIIRESEALEFYAVTETPDDIGGLGVLKEWLRLRERAFTQEARDYGLPAPKGIALIGRTATPGTTVRLPARDHRCAAQLATRRTCAVSVVPGNPGSGAAICALAN
jgi:hypothetical protein